MAANCSGGSQPDDAILPRTAVEEFQAGTSDEVEGTGAKFARLQRESVSHVLFCAPPQLWLSQVDMMSLKQTPNARYGRFSST